LSDLSLENKEALMARARALMTRDEQEDKS
jgi:hypothetical protein